jgi:hypothetical protein
MVTIKPVKHNHLGDLINILQFNKADYIYVQHQCSCCGQDLRVMVKTLLNFMGNKVRVVDEPIGDVVDVKPTYAQEFENKHGSWSKLGTFIWQRTPYKKIKLDVVKENYVACQFDHRSNPPWPKGITEHKIQALTKIVKLPLVNIGDKHRISMLNRTEVSLEEKTKIIAKAKAYVGIDSGLTHVALMTETPTYVVYEFPYCPWFFYPDGPIFVQDIHLLDVVN